MSLIRKMLPPLVPAIILVVFLEIVVRLGLLPSYLFPAPSSVVKSLAVDSEELWMAMIQTGLGASVGFGASLVIGIGVGLLLSTSERLQRVVYPYTVFFQTVPIIAIAPLLVIWFGYGLPTVIASSFIVSLFPVLASALLGFRSTEPALLDLFNLYSANRRDRMLKLRFPSALPFLLGGARVAAGLAVIGAVVGEFITGGGLGGLIDVARTQQRLDRVFASVLLASVLGLIAFWGINSVSRYLLRHWHASEQSPK